MLNQVVKSVFRLFDKINKGGVYVIAEMSANHGGNIDNAIEIVHHVAQAGADCLKIQTYTADSITIDCNSEEFQVDGGLCDGYKLYDLYKYSETPYEWHKQIKAECELCGIDFLSTPFDRADVDFLESINCEAYKIASFELIDIPLIEYVASKRKPIIISCGMGSIEEINEALMACYNVENNNVVLLKCCSEYPACIEDMNLATIADMKKRFNVPVGFSDHSEGNIADIVAVSMGACIIEKHVKLDDVESVDSGFSMCIESFAVMVDSIKDVRNMAGSIKYGPNIGEMGNFKLRRSLFVSENIKAGETFTEKNIRSIRPSGGIKPKYYQNIIGKKALVDLKKGSPLLLENIEGL